MADAPTQPTPGAPAMDPPPTNPPTAPPPAPQATEAPPTGETDQLGDAGKRALDAERAARRDAEQRLKELEPLAAKAKELEDAQKTETQKLADQLQAATADRAESNTSLMQLQVALDKAPAGMDPGKIAKLAERLRGSTREEMQADAAELFADFNPGTPSGTPPANGGQQTPVEQLKPGALPTTQEPTTAERIAAAEKAGDHDTARRLKSQQLMELQTNTS